MKTRIKHSLASVLALVLALAMAVPAFAADPQEGGEGQTQPPVAETETGNTGASDKTGTGEETTGDEQAPADTSTTATVGTVDALIEALKNDDITEIAFSEDIDTTHWTGNSTDFVTGVHNGGTGFQTDIIFIDHDVTIDLGGHVWTSNHVRIDNDDSVGNTPSGNSYTVEICNGTLWVGDNATAIRQEMGQLILDDLKVRGKYNISNAATAQIIGCTITNMGQPSAGGNLNGDYCAIQFSQGSSAQIQSITNSTIEAYGSGIVGSGTIGSIQNSTISATAGSGLAVSKIGTIDDATISGGEAGIRLYANYEIGSITVGNGTSISSIVGGVIDDDGSIINSGTIGSADARYGIYVDWSQGDPGKNGYIGAISNVDILAASTGIVGLGTIGSISGCDITVSTEGSEYEYAYGMQLGYHVGTIEDNEIKADFIGIASSGTVDQISGNHIQAGTYTIRNNGIIDSIEGNALAATSSIYNTGSIDSIRNNRLSSIESNINNYGTIRSIDDNELTSDSRGIRNAGEEAVITNITNNDITAGGESQEWPCGIYNFAEIGHIENNVITTTGISNQGIFNGVGQNDDGSVANVGVIRSIEDNTITANSAPDSYSYAIMNSAYIDALGENTLSGNTVFEDFPQYVVDVLNAGGNLNITAAGDLYTDENGILLFTSDSGWLVFNNGDGGTITHEEEPDYPDIPVDPPIRPTDPVEPEEPEEPDETTETVTNPDGSTTTTVTDNTTGTVTETTQYENGVALEIVTSAEGDRDISVTVPSGVTQATVTIPMDQVGLGTVAVDAATGEVVKQSIPSESGLSVTLDASAQLIVVDNTKNFADTAAHWAGDAITFVTARELFNGISDTTFAADLPMSRAMLTTVLARLEGVDTTTGSTWYEAGMSWAVEQGISDGSAPDSDITREDLYTMLYRYAGSPAVSGDLSGYPDGSTVSDYAQSAMAWAVETGLCTGTGAGTLDPQGDASRAQVATILMRFMTL